MRINAPISLSDREKELVARLTRRVPRIRVSIERPEPEEKPSCNEEPRASVLDRMLRRKPKHYPY